jgi:hypothetical protein
VTEDGLDEVLETWRDVTVAAPAPSVAGIPAG